MANSPQEHQAWERVLLGGPWTTTRRRGFIWRRRRLWLALGLLGFGALIVVYSVLARIELDVTATNTDDLARTSLICTSDTAECSPDNAVARLSAGEDRELVPLSRVPDHVISAVVATEDKDFFNHRGVDPVGIGRALYRDLSSDGALQGGSTITQQLVKLTYTGGDRSVGRKLREATLAVKLERELTKNQILENYLNRIYFGRGAYGIQAAALNYYGTNVEDLTLAQGAFLAGLIRAPSRADPLTDPDEADRRRRVTLSLMAEEGYITVAEEVAAADSPWDDVIAKPDREGLGDITGEEYGMAYIVEAVRQDLAELYPGGALYTSGLRVFLTIDPTLQQAAFESVSEVVDPRVDPSDPSASLVAVDEQGQVRALVGGYDFDTSQVNLALGRQGGGSGRQPGSSFKPFALAAALEQGYSAHSLFPAPSSISLTGADNGNDWNVSGGGSPDGYRDLVDALRVSSNVVYAQLMLEVGPPQVVDLARRLGVEAELDPVPALVLGSGEVSVLDMAASYSTLANQGVRYEPVLIERVEGPDGICWYPRNGTCADGGPGRSPDDPRAIEPAVAQQVTFALEQVVQSGTGRAAAFGEPAAGKTGTTQDSRDAWFVGFSCDMTAAVWMGFPGTDGQAVQPMTNIRGLGEVHGGDFPAEIWAAFMTRARSRLDELGHPPCTTLAGSDSSQGIQLNPELSTTTTLECPTDSSEDPDASTEPPATQDPATQPGEAPGSLDDCPPSDGEEPEGDPSSTTTPATPTTGSPTSTTAPSTSTTAPPPSSTTTTSAPPTSPAEDDPDQ